MFLFVVLAQTDKQSIHNQQDLACQQIANYVTFRTILVGCPKDVALHSSILRKAV